MNVDYHQMSNFIGARLPGTGVWFHCVPTEEAYRPDSSRIQVPTQRTHRPTDYPIGEGLAIRRREPDESLITNDVTSSWIVLYFSIHDIDNDNNDESNDESNDTGSDEDSEEGLILSIGFTREYDTLDQARAEARELVGYLPVPESVGEEASQRMHDLVFEAIDSLIDDPMDDPDL